MRTGALAALGIAAAALLGLLGAAVPATATSPGANGRIFFTARAPASDSGCGIASVRPNGTGYNCVYPFGRDPAVSPTNSRISFVDGDQLVEVYSSDMNGKGVRRLTHAPGEFPSSYSPSFSPDGNSILFFKYGGAFDEDGLYLMNADGGTERQLTSDGGQEPVFSPNGAQIAYERNGILIANADGSGANRILEDQNHATTNPFGHYLEDNGEPSWAPDGSRIAFSRRARTDTLICNPAPPSCTGTQTDDQQDVFTMNPDGTDIRRLTSTPGRDEVDPAYSPDGQTIAYYRRPDGDNNRGEVWVMNADGSGQHRVALGSYPEWSTLQGGPAQPRLVFRFQRINRHRSCLAKYDGWTARVKTPGLRATRFHIAFYVDGKFIYDTSNTRFLGLGVDSVHGRHGSTHRVRVVVEDSAPRDRISRTFKFRIC
jgi:dipeptidyl aminopeptidase/acylaminoacyl peptidase